jgi:hypothetical protein
MPFMKVRIWKNVCITALVATLGCAGTAWAASCPTPLCPFLGNIAGPFDFRDNQYAANFTDVRRGTDINDNGALDLGGTGHTALNFTGGAGPAGDLWLTEYSGPGLTGSTFSGVAGICIKADVLIHTYNNAKGAGLVTLLNVVEGEGGTGLAVIVYDQGNSDGLQLATIDTGTGELGKLKGVKLGASIAENAWYRVVMFVQAGADITGDALHVEAKVFRHWTPTDPSSPAIQVVGTLVFDGTLSGAGLETIGKVGIAASAFSTNVNSSVTNWFAMDEADSCAAL